MGNASTALQADWLGTCRRAAEELAALLDARPTTAERASDTGSRATTASAYARSR